MVDCIGRHGYLTLTPFQKFAPCSKAVFMTFTATEYSTRDRGFVRPGRVVSPHSA